MLTPDIIRALTRAIDTIQAGQHDPARAHQRMEDMYSWAAVAARTERVYRRVMRQPVWTPYERLSRLLSLGPVFGPILCAITAVQWWWYLFVCAVVPESAIEAVEDDWDAERFEQVSTQRRLRLTPGRKGGAGEEVKAEGQSCRHRRKRRERSAGGAAQRGPGRP